MTPDHIQQFVSVEFPSIVSETRQNPSGWAFFLGSPVRGIHSNRIFRALRNGPDSVTRLKLAVSCRHESTDVEIDFVGDEIALRTLIENEIAVFRKHFLKS